MELVLNFDLYGIIVDAHDRWNITSYLWNMWIVVHGITIGSCVTQASSIVVNWFTVTMPYLEYFWIEYGYPDAISPLIYGYERSELYISIYIYMEYPHLSKWVLTVWKLNCIWNIPQMDKDIYYSIYTGWTQNFLPTYWISPLMVPQNVNQPGLSLRIWYFQVIGFTIGLWLARKFALLTSHHNFQRHGSHDLPVERSWIVMNPNLNQKNQSL
jgi:hypothetical protein